MSDDENRVIRTSSNKVQGTAPGWTATDYLKGASILTTFLVAVFSTVIGLHSNKAASDNAQAIETDRTEIGHIYSNSNDFDFANEWSPWEEPVTPTTTYIGVQRKIFFKRPFLTVPSVSTAFSLIDVKPTDQILQELYNRNTNSNDVADIHIVTFASGITEKEFTLKVGIGMRRAPGELLSVKLGNPVETDFVAAMMRYGQLADRPNLKLTREELWMVNFYRDVGTFVTSWAAQGRQ